METRRKRCHEGAAGEQMSSVLIKQELEWLAEDSHAPDFGNQEVQLDIESLRSIKTEQDPYNTDEAADAVQEFTPVPQTDDYIRAELLLGEEVRDQMSGLDGDYKQHILALADDHLAKVSKSVKKVCESSFKHTKQLDQAQSTTPFECLLCLRKFKRKSVLKKHLSIHEKQEFQCDLCEKKFYSQKILRNHIERHGKPKHKCAFCSRPFKQKQHLESHLRTHTTNRKPEFACDICERAFYDKRTLVRHMKIYAQRNHPKFKCEVCDSIFAKKGDLDAHLLTNHLKKSQPIATAPQTVDHNFREQRFTTEPANDTGVPMKTELMSDEEFVVEGNDRDSVSHAENLTSEKYTSILDARPYACEQCESRFRFKRYLKSHRDTQHTKHRIPEFCEKCGKKFYTKHGLRAHLWTHTGVTVSCEVCGARFKQKQSLRTHMVRKHKSKTHPFTPDPQTAMDDSIQTKEELNSDEDFLDEEMRNFACDICEGKFYSKGGLLAHKKMHTRQLKLKPQPSNDTGVPMKAEQMLAERYIDEGKDGDTVGKDEKSQETTVATDKQRTRVGKVKDSVTSHKRYPGKSIETHVRTKHGDRTYTKSRVCLQQSTFAEPTSLLDNHTRPFVCELCGSEFLAKNGLKQHIDTQHTENRIPLFCELCEKKYYTKNGLKYHMKTHTAKTQSVTLDSHTANGDSVETKEELKSDEEFLD